MVTESLTGAQEVRKVLLISDSVPRAHSPSSIRFGEFSLELAQQGHEVTFLPLTLHRGTSSPLIDRMDSNGVAIITNDAAENVFSFLEAHGHSFDLIVLSAKAAQDVRNPVDRFAPMCERVVDLVGAEVEFSSASLQGLSAALVAEQTTDTESDVPQLLAPINISEAVDVANASAFDSDEVDDDRPPAILHLHLFKNAGSSVDAALVAAYGERWLSFDAPFHSEPVGPTDLVRLLQARPELKAVSSHQIRPPLPRNLKVLPLVFLRDPIARLASVFDYYHGSGSENPNGEAVRKFETISDYAESSLDSDDGLVINFHVRFLAGTAHTVERQPVSELLSKAAEFCRSVPYVGSVETFSDSLRTYQSLIRESVDDQFEFVERHENRSRNSTAKLSARDRLGEALTTRLEHANWADRELLQEFSPASLKKWQTPEGVSTV